MGERQRKKGIIGTVRSALGIMSSAELEEKSDLVAQIKRYADRVGIPISEDTLMDLFKRPNEELEAIAREYEQMVTYQSGPAIYQYSEQSQDDQVYVGDVASSDTETEEEWEWMPDYSTEEEWELIPDNSEVDGVGDNIISTSEEVYNVPDFDEVEIYKPADNELDTEYDYRTESQNASDILNTEEGNELLIANIMDLSLQLGVDFDIASLNKKSTDELIAYLNKLGIIKNRKMKFEKTGRLGNKLGTQLQMQRDISRLLGELNDNFRRATYYRLDMGMESQKYQMAIMLINTGYPELGLFQLKEVLSLVQYKLNHRLSIEQRLEQLVRQRYDATAEGVDIQMVDALINRARYHIGRNEINLASTYMSQAENVLRPGDVKSQHHKVSGAASHQQGEASRTEAEKGRSNTPDYYAILQVPRTATPAQIRKSYARLMHMYHPDKVHNLGEKMRELAEAESKKINEAYSVLKDAEKRAKYDASLDRQ